MSILLWVSLIAAAGIIAIHLVVAAGAVLALVAERHLIAIEAEIEPGRVSVVVPARDEEEMLPRLLACLERQNTNRFEIVLVNDRSEDRTSDIMQEFSARHEGRVRVVTLVDDPPPGNPKQRALAAGASAATGDLLLLTDADCWLPVDWVRTMCRPFRSHDVGLVFGPVIPGTKGLARQSRFLDWYQGFDQIFRFQYTAGAAGMGAPSGGFGNNIAVRRSALNDAGGFEGLRYSQTEDAQLICQIRDTGKWAIRAVRSRGARVVPAPEQKLRTLIRQSIRWNTGGLFAPDQTARLSYGVVMIFLFASVLLAISSIFVPVGAHATVVMVLPAFGSFVSMLLLGVLAGLFNRPGPWYWPLLVPNIILSMV
ncbi:MAG: glycosyltransferase, partial [Spirochaetales bacterium]